MDIFCENGLMMQLKKSIVECVMEGGLTTELSYNKLHELCDCALCWQCRVYNRRKSSWITSGDKK
jgi:hypothetical protein